MGKILAWHLNGCRWGNIGGGVYTLERGKQAPAGEASYPSAALGWLPGRSQLPRAMRSAGLGKLPQCKQLGIEPHFSPWKSVSSKSERG